MKHASNVCCGLQSETSMLSTKYLLVTFKGRHRLILKSLLNKKKCPQCLPSYFLAISFLDHK